MQVEFKGSLGGLRLWSDGFGRQGQGFPKGIVIGFCVAAILLFVATFRRDGDDAVRHEVARRGGYSECCVDVMGIISHGGGIDEVIAFARAKGETGFSSLVNPTNFYLNSASRRERGLAMAGPQGR